MKCIYESLLDPMLCFRKYPKIQYKHLFGYGPKDTKTFLDENPKDTKTFLDLKTIKDTKTFWIKPKETETMPTSMTIKRDHGMPNAQLQLFK